MMMLSPFDMVDQQRQLQTRMLLQQQLQNRNLLQQQAQQQQSLQQQVSFLLFLKYRFVKNNLKCLR